MHAKLLKSRPGFTLAEALVSLVITAIIGAGLMGVFVTQSRFFDDQEKRSMARSVARGAMNVALSELRMIERDSGIVSASPRHLTVRVPYAMGLFCALSGTEPVFSLIPLDTMMLRDAGHTGYAYRTASNGRYTYVSSARDSAAASLCGAVHIRTFADSGGRVLRMKTAPPVGAPALVKGTPVMLYQRITYEFKASVDVPGATALWRRIDGKGVDEELVAPFDTTAAFRFFVNDSAKSVVSPPTQLNRVTGVELVLNGRTESPAGRQKVIPMSTSVFFRNR